LRQLSRRTRDENQIVRKETNANTLLNRAKLAVSNLFASFQLAPVAAA